MPIAALPKALLIKNEAVYKTDIVPTGAANAILLREDPTLTPIETDKDERNNAKAYFGQNQMLVAAVRRKLSFAVEFGGCGTPLGAPAPYSCLLRACAMNQVIVATTSVTHSPVTNVVDSASIYFWQGDKKYIRVGARGNAKMMFAAGKIPLMMFDFIGLLPAANDVIDDSGYGGALTLTGW